MAKVTEAQTRASNKWNANNRDRSNYLRKKSSAKSFITDNKGTNKQQPDYIDDLMELKNLIDNKVSNL